MALGQASALGTWAHVSLAAKLLSMYLEGFSLLLGPGAVPSN